LNSFCLAEIFVAAMLIIPAANKNSHYPDLILDHDTIIYFFPSTLNCTSRLFEIVLVPPIPKSFRLIVNVPLKRYPSPEGVAVKGNEISLYDL